jgi:hypothetical protein
MQVLCCESSTQAIVGEMTDISECIGCGRKIVERVVAIRRSGKARVMLDYIHKIAKCVDYRVFLIAIGVSCRCFPYYDFLSFAQVNVGNNTRTEDWISGTRYASTTKTFTA